MNRLALCIGINAYPGAELSGCLNDALDWKKALEQRGFQVQTLLDTEATLANIVAAIRATMAMTHYRDRVVITYSGHGTYGRDFNGDEPDAADEAICPVDVFTKGSLYDDEIKQLLGDRPFGVRTFFVADSCYSGTIARFMGGSVNPRVRAKFLPPSAAAPRRKEITVPRTIVRPVLSLSGCKDDEVSYDAWFGNRPNGALSRVALDTLAQNPSTYQAWHRAIRTVLPSEDYPQSPQLDGSLYRRTRVPLV